MSVGATPAAPMVSTAGLTERVVLVPSPAVSSPRFASASPTRMSESVTGGVSRASSGCELIGRSPAGGEILRCDSKGN